MNFGRRARSCMDRLEQCLLVGEECVRLPRHVSGPMGWRGGRYETGVFLHQVKHFKSSSVRMLEKKKKKKP